MYRLKSNKTKMVRLLHGHGFDPTVRGSHYQKLPSGSCTLTWWQPEGNYEAYLTAAGFRPYCTVTHDGHVQELIVLVGELKKLDMLRQI